MKLNAAASGGIIMEINGSECFKLDSNHWIRLNGMEVLLIRGAISTTLQPGFIINVVKVMLNLYKLNR